MAQASKQRPWAVEMKPPGTENWFHLDAYRDQAEAKMQATLARRRAKGRAEVRIRDMRDAA